MKFYSLSSCSLIVCTFILLGCGGDVQKFQNQKNNSEIFQKPLIKAPDFNADSAFYFIQKQVEFGPRIPNTASHKKCGEWLYAKLKSYTPEVIAQQAEVTAYTGERLSIVNYMARFNPASSNRILLCAHWDTRPFADKDPQNPKAKFDGADDGASGVGILIEIARLISIQAPAAGIDIVLFDGEDYGNSEGEAETYCLGAQYWAANLPVKGYYAKFGILLDMVGAKNAKFNREGYSSSTAISTLDKVWNTASRLGYAQYFINNNVPGITDDHIFVNQKTGIPVIDIINYDKAQSKYGFPVHWHTQNDNISIIDKNTLKAVGETVLDVIYNE